MQSFEKKIQWPLSGSVMINRTVRHKDCLLEPHYATKKYVPL